VQPPGTRVSTRRLDSTIDDPEKPACLGEAIQIGEPEVKRRRAWVAPLAECALPATSQPCNARRSASLLFRPAASATRESSKGREVSSTEQ
jgi:hypothetical protein